MSAEYFAPEFRVEVNGRALAADISKHVADLSVTLASGAVDSLQLTLANPYPELRWTHTDHAGLFREGSSVKVSMGYAGTPPVPMFDGELTGTSPTFPESGSPTVAVEGFSRLHRLQQRFDPVTVQNATDADLVKKIAEASRLSAKVAGNPGITHPWLSTGQAAHLPYLLELARAAGREVWVEGTTLHFAPSRAGGEPVYTLVWGRTADSWVQGSVPLQSFTASLDVRRQVNTVVVRGHDPLTGDAIEGRAGEGDEDADLGGSETGPRARSASLGGPTGLVVAWAPVSSQHEADARARALYNERAMEFIEGSGATLGLPKLRAGTVVTLGGLGSRFNGNYYVTRATHSIGGGGYRTTFQVRRNAAG